MNDFLAHFEFTSSPIQSASSVEIGDEVADRGDLFDRIARAFRFPAYFGRNWDAFVDCLSDLGWSDAEELVIDHPSLPAMAPREVRLYLECLVDAASRRSPEERPRLRLAFRERDRRAIEDALRESPPEAS